jgi:outer membrane protein assembly factor BamD (BamD/ComL family)
MVRKNNFGRVFPGIKFFICAGTLVFFLSVSGLPAQTAATASRITLAEGYQAYKNSDWITAIFFLRKFVSQNQPADAGTWYMLIMAQMYAGEYQSAAADCSTFMAKFPKSMYCSYVQYQRGRACFYLGDYNKTVLLLSDFCHQYPDHEMYPSALFWIAESFYADGNYTSSRPLYERIVSDFQTDAKSAQAQFRIESIDQRNREKKLLYLLKVTGEEYLSAKEDYEKQLQLYKSSDIPGLTEKIRTAKNENELLGRQLDAEKKQNSELLQKIADLENRITALSSQTPGTDLSANPKNSGDIEKLKAKAQQVQELLNSQQNGGE